MEWLKNQSKRRRKKESCKSRIKQKAQNKNVLLYKICNAFKILKDKDFKRELTK